MNANAIQPVTIQTTVNAPVAKVWESWNAPEHITKWNSPQQGWQAILDNFKKYTETL
jgi:uncharacterized protein YndB with AHSA1/START domain